MNDKKLDNYFKDRLNFNELKIDVDAAYKKVVSNLSFEKQSKIQQGLLVIKKKVFYPLMTAICLFLIGTSTITTYFIMKNDGTENIVNSIVSSEEYIKVASEYILQKENIYMEKQPIRNIYFPNNYVFNIYKAMDLDDLEGQTLYYVQLYALSDPTNNIRLELINSENIVFEMNSLKEEKNIMDCLNNKEGLINENLNIILNTYVNDLLIDNRKVL